MRKKGSVNRGTSLPSDYHIVSKQSQKGTETWGGAAMHCRVNLRHGGIPAPFFISLSSTCRSDASATNPLNTHPPVAQKGASQSYCSTLSDSPGEALCYNSHPSRLQKARKGSITESHCNKRLLTGAL